MSEGSRVRLDRWLWPRASSRPARSRPRPSAVARSQWAARGPKRAKLLAVGDRLRIRRGPFEYSVVVRALSEHRGPSGGGGGALRGRREGKRLREHLADSSAWPRRSATRGREGPRKGSGARSNGSEVSEDPHRRSAEHEPRRVHPNRISTSPLISASATVEKSTSAARPELPGDHGHEGE